MADTFRTLKVINKFKGSDKTNPISDYSTFGNLMILHDTFYNYINELELREYFYK